MVAPPAVVPTPAAAALPTGLAEVVFADVETTLYGDLPEDFWGERQGGGVHPEDEASSGPTTRGERAAATSNGAPLSGKEESGPGADDAHDSAVGLFTAGAREAGSPTHTSARSQTEPPPEPEGERFGQLQALFPGRIIEVTRRDRGAAHAAATTDETSGVPASEYDGQDDGSGTAIDESADEPRYDTAAEAAADLDGEAGVAAPAKESR